jgi:hypothetical protein
MKTVEKTVQHCWKPMEKFQIDDVMDVEDLMVGSPEEKINILRKLKPNQYVSISFIREYTKPLELYLQKLKENGLDIGRGDCEYGYRMPLPQNGNRQLIIFRRHL